MARTRLQYDEARKHLQYLQQKMAELEDRIAPGQSESDKDRLLLIQEKEQLLRELRSIAPRSRSKPEMETVRTKIQRLEQDLSQALEASNRTIADRLKLHEEKQILLQSMRQALRNVALLEGQLRSLSASTLSMSSSSSLGSLSTSSRSHASSKVIATQIYLLPIPFYLTDKRNVFLVQSNLLIDLLSNDDICDILSKIRRILKKKKIFKNDSQNPDNGIASFFFFNCDNLTQFTNNKNIN